MKNKKSCLFEKNKLIAGLILIIFSFLIALNLYETKAAGGEEGNLIGTGPNMAVEEIVTISQSSANIKIDEALQLTATSSIDSDITWTSSDTEIATVSSNGLVKGVKEGTAVITAKGSDGLATCNVTISKASDEIVWTDFSNAKFELKKDGISKSIIEISNVTPKDDHNYYLFITSNSSKPNVTSDMSDDRIFLSYDNDSKMFKTLDTDKIAKNVELNQDLYVTIVEVKSLDENIVLYGKKLERYSESQYTDAFFATFMSNTADQIVTTFTHAEANNRKMQIKVGKITDTAILRKIKNQDSSGFADLLAFAKSSNGIYNKTLDSDKDNSGYAIEYSGGWASDSGNSIINLNGLEKDAYYFLYVRTDDENGKYISGEGVTFAQAGVSGNEWSMIFYGTSDFKWADFGSDTTTKPGTLPQTGEGITIAVSIVVIVGIAVFFEKKYKKYNI